MISQPPYYRIYLLTVWQERSRGPPVQITWRFRLEDPRTRRQQVFADAATFMTALQQLIASGQEAEGNMMSTTESRAFIQLALLPKGANLSTTKEGINTSDAPPGPTTVYQNRLAVTEPLGEFELVQLIVDFPAGTWTPAHTHGGELLVTVLNGEQTVRDEQGAEKIYKAGESFIETPGEYLEIGNAGQDLVKVSALALLPKGATLSTTKEGISTDNAPPGPTTLYQARLAANSVAAP